MRLLFLSALISALCIGVASCKKEKVYRIGVSQCSQDDWRSKMNDEIQREIMFHPEATVEIRSADDDNARQIADIRYFMDSGFDIIIAAPNEADAITPVISEAYRSGIPVIIFDRSINGEDYTAYFGVDNKGIGKAAAHYARHLVGPGAKVIEIRGLDGSTPAADRSSGFSEEAKAIGDMKIISSADGHWNYEDALKVADTMVRNHPEANVVYAHNDRMAIAASDASRKQGKKLYIIGVDAAPGIGIKAVADSVIDATFLYPTEGHKLVRTAMAILKGEPFQRHITMPASSAVDKTNADILLLQNESLKEETSKIQLLKSQVDDYWSKHSAQTTLFYAVIAILVLLFGTVFLLLRAFWQRRRHQNELMEQNKLLEQQRDKQRRLNEQLQEATKSKLVFFTNVSHDLRTPLTLIAEPVEQLAGASNLTQQQQTLMKIADKNVRILRRLINQILDFRKFENGRLDLNLTEVTPAGLIREWAESFEGMARKRDIALSIDIVADEGFTAALDVEKLERVFFNLVSNAFKYTPDHGHITVSYTADGQRLLLKVGDDGQGISPEDVTKIFDRFFQVDKIHPKGSGIGLSLAKAFIELHGGTITVDSEPGRGSEFTVTLPVRHIAAQAVKVEPKVMIGSDIEAELSPIEDVVNEGDSSLPLMLVIDDNADIRKMVSSLLSDEYRIITARDGREGLRMAAKYTPDIIICDVMMPEMDGLECCRKLKEEISTSHIPVLMLTACSMDEQRCEGYENGADGYLSKPFNSAVLRSRCKSLIDNRRRIRDLWGAGIMPVPSRTSGMPAPSPAELNGGIDSEFYGRFVALVDKEMSDPDLNVENLARQMGLGRSQFYRKIKALTNYSPVELLRRMRLQRARTLLTSTEKTVSEIAYEVGFATPAYFTRCYREAYGETPTALREKLS